MHQGAYQRAFDTFQESLRRFRALGEDVRINVSSMGASQLPLTTIATTSARTGADVNDPHPGRLEQERDRVVMGTLLRSGDQLRVAPADLLPGDGAGEEGPKRKMCRGAASEFSRG